MAQTDSELLEAARAGDRAALEALLVRHQDQVYRFGMKLCRDPADAEDVVQNTLLAMARSIGDFEGRSSLSTWLYSIARSYCIKQRRKSKFAPDEVKSLDTQVAPESAVLADAARAPDEAALGHEIEAALEEAIRALDPEYRDVLVLRDLEGLTAAEVAEVLELSVAAVKSRLHRARLQVRERVAPVLGVDAPVDAPSTDACPDILLMYSQHLEDEISAELCGEMERHVAGCARCRGTCDSLKRTLVLCKSTGRAAHVPASLQDSVRAALREFLAEAR